VVVTAPEIAACIQEETGRKAKDQPSEWGAWGRTDLAE